MPFTLKQVLRELCGLMSRTDAQLEDAIKARTDIDTPPYRPTRDYRILWLLEHAGWDK